MKNQSTIRKAPRNKTISLLSDEFVTYSKRLVRLTQSAQLNAVLNKTINQDIFEILSYLPSDFVDLLVIDPPYNLRKSYNGSVFKSKSNDEYAKWFECWFIPLLRILKKTASVYICSDWKTSSIIQPILEEHLVIQNRITWEREKGRGAKNNWKNCSEDVWFCTTSNNYTFNVDAVKMRRKVIAPYKDALGKPKDWEESEQGNYRTTYPSNLWTDITIPFWSMPENTEHPTQKPEKLLAKIILAGSNPDDIVFDPFLGSGTTSVVAKKLDRNYIGVEIDPTYCCLAEKRLERVESCKRIQGYSDEVFWERNSVPTTPASKGGK